MKDASKGILGLLNIKSELVVLEVIRGYNYLNECLKMVYYLKRALVYFSTQMMRPFTSS